MLANPQALLDIPQRGPSLTFSTGSRKVLGLSLLGIAAALAALWSVHIAGKMAARVGVSPQRAQLVAALGPFRPSEARLVGFDYAPPASLPARGWRTPAVSAAFQAIERDADLHRTPQALADRAVTLLLNGQVDDAVTDLRRAARSSPGDARIESDLAATLFIRGEAEQQPHDLVLGIAAAFRALAADPDLPEARFNLAVGFQKLFLLNEEREAWREYLQVDPGSTWSDEVRERLEAGQIPGWQPDLDKAALAEAVLRGDHRRAREIVLRQPQQARLYAEKELLAEWAETCATGDPARAERSLRIARGIGNVLAGTAGDLLLRDSVATIDRVLAEPPGSGAAALLAGHRRYGEGLKLSGQQLDSQALVAFRDSARLLTQVESPFRYRAMMRAAACEKNLMNPQGVLRWVEPVRAGADPRRYPNLAGEALWVSGTTQASLADFPAALSFYQAALPFFRRTHEEENLAFVHYLLAESLFFEAETQVAWKHRYQALEIGRRHPTSAAIPVHNALLDMARAALREGMPAVALRFQDESVRHALSGSNPISKVEALTERSQTWQRLGDEDSGYRDLRQAETLLATMGADGLRRRLQTDGDVARGQSRRATSLRDAAALLGQAIDLFRDRLEPRIPKLLLDRGLLWREMGEIDRAEQDLESSVRAFERQKTRQPGDWLQPSYFEEARQAFEQMIDLQVEERHDPRRAFAYSERLRDLPAAPTGDPSKTADSAVPTDPPSVEALQAQLPADVSVVEYLVTRKGLSAWVLDRERFQSVDLHADPASVKAAVGALQTAMLARASASAAAPLARRLHDLLIAPLERQAELRRTLIIIPDRDLYRVPFAGLIHPETGRYLVEDRFVAVAPSAAAYAAALRRGKALEEGGEAKAASALVVGDPAFDRGRFPDLGDLPGAAAEARWVAGLYGVQPLTGDAATKSSFLARAPEAGSIHWAGHAGLNADLPMLSYLLLAPESGSPAPGDTGLLSAAEIRRIPLTNTRLVVLAACRSAGQGAATGEGLSGLPRAFLDAGVPVVIGHLWPLEDRETTGFLTDFYRSLRAGRTPLAALHAAQLAALSHSDRKRRGSANWAGFQIFGGVSAQP
jgi:CHAT domain-containing protein/tetratricopeptide (TPR) repeat protein